MWKRSDPEKEALARENQSLRQDIGWLRARISSLEEQSVSLHQVLARQVQEAVQRTQEALIGQIKTLCQACVLGELDYSLPAPDTVEQWDAVAWLSWLAEALRKEIRSLQADRAARGCEVEALRKENEAQGQQLSDCLEILDYWEEAQLLLEQRLYDAGIPDPLEPALPTAPTPDPPGTAETVTAPVVAAAGTGGDKSGLEALICELARGEECRRAELLRILEVHSAGMGNALFRQAIHNGLVSVVEARLGPGRPTDLLRLTEQGQELAQSLGVTPTGGASELLKRHRSPGQALLVLRARDLLISWGYRVNTWPRFFRTPAGRQCRPDLELIDPQEADEEWASTYVEVELHPQPSPNYAQDDERVQKWRIFSEVNHGVLFAVTLSERHEEKLVEEIRQWHEVTGEPVELDCTNVTSPDFDRWAEWQFE